MPYIPPEVMARAREMDLLTYPANLRDAGAGAFRGRHLLHPRARQLEDLQRQMVLIFP